MRLTGSVLSARPVGSLVLRPIAQRGYRRYRDTDETPGSAYAAMRKLFAADPRAFDRLVADAQVEHPLLDGIEARRGIASDEIAAAVDGLRRDGYVVLSRLLPEAECADLEDVARRSQCSLVAAGPGAPEHARFDSDRPIAIRYDLAEIDVLRCRAAQRLLADQSLLALAQEYLGTAPVQDMVAMWWSTAAGDAPASSSAAQQFHFDLDRLRFLKVFVYLTDVDRDTGPHVFVRGSHRDLRKPFRFDRRYSDGEVNAEFADDVVTIVGPRGTVLLADTRGLHKGEPLRRGNRLVFQMEYTTSLFGQAVDRVCLRDPVPEFASVLERFPYTFRRFRAIEG